MPLRMVPGESEPGGNQNPIIEYFRAPRQNITQPDSGIPSDECCDVLQTPLPSADQEWPMFLDLMAPFAVLFIGWLAFFVVRHWKPWVRSIHRADTVVLLRDLAAKDEEIP